jgi:hypothetical protein
MTVRTMPSVRFGTTRPPWFECVGAMRRREHLHVVGRQYIDVNGAAVFHRRRRNPVAVLRMIFLAEVDPLAIVAALDDVQRLGD